MVVVQQPRHSFEKPAPVNEIEMFNDSVWFFPRAIDKAAAEMRILHLLRLESESGFDGSPISPRLPASVSFNPIHSLGQSIDSSRGS